MARKIERKRGRKLPESAAETEALSDDDVLAAVFGKVAQKALKRQALSNSDETDETPTTTT
jgi:hypothetical protein